MSGPPSGWPEGLPPPGVPGWRERAAGYLLDACPGEYRDYPLLRRHPKVLAFLAEAHVAAAQEAAVGALARARPALDALVAPEVVEAAVGVCELEVRRLARTRTEVARVAAALRADHGFGPGRS